VASGSNGRVRTRRRAVTNNSKRCGDEQWRGVDLATLLRLKGSDDVTATKGSDVAAALAGRCGGRSNNAAAGSDAAARATT